MTYIWLMFTKKSLQSKGLKGFDPYEILSVSSSSTDKEIRKSFRTLAKQYHPDKNPGDPNA